MKQNIFVNLFLLVIGFLFSSCESDIIWDIAPVEIEVSVRDASGADLLNPSAEGTLACESTRLFFEGEYYYLQDLSQEMSTRYLMPDFYGIKLGKDSSGYVLHIGEFDGHKNSEMTEMIIEWSDGTTDTFAYSRRVKGQSSKRLKIRTRFYHNGEEVDSSKINLVK